MVSMTGMAWHCAIAALFATRMGIRASMGAWRAAAWMLMGMALIL